MVRKGGRARRARSKKITGAVAAVPIRSRRGYAEPQDGHGHTHSFIRLERGHQLLLPCTAGNRIDVNSGVFPARPSSHLGTCW